MSSIHGYAQLIRQSKHLSHLSLDLNDAQDSTFANTLQDSADSNGMLVKTLFRHIAPFATSKPLLLHDLQLSGICLSWSDRTFSRVIDMCKLRAFCIWECEGASVLLRNLARTIQKDGCALKIPSSRVQARSQRKL